MITLYWTDSNELKRAIGEARCQGGEIDSEKQCLKKILNEMEKRSGDSEAGKEKHNEK